MTDLLSEKTLRRRPLWHPRTVVGAFAQRRYREDPLIRGIVKGGAAFILLFLVLLWQVQERREERADRRQQHADTIRAMREMHEEDLRERRTMRDEDLRERRLDRCINSQLSDTVRAAIWHEKPRRREECR